MEKNNEQKTQPLVPYEDLKIQNWEDLPRLTTQQQAYADLFCLNPHLSPIECYRRSYNTTEANAAKNFRRVFENDKFKKYVRIMKGAITQYLGVTEPQIIHLLTLKATAEITQVMQWDKNGRVTYTPSEDLPESARYALSDFEIHEIPILDQDGQPFYDSKGIVANRKVKVRMKDQLKALEMLGNYLGLWDNQDKKDASRLERLNNFMQWLKDNQGNQEKKIDG